MEALEKLNKWFKQKPFNSLEITDEYIQVMTNHEKSLWIYASPSLARKYEDAFGDFGVSIGTDEKPATPSDMLLYFIRKYCNGDQASPY